jgi:hypothetical protein
MRLYLANPTGQTRRYYYRLDYNERGEFSEEMRKRSQRFVQVESGKQGVVDLQHISQVQTVMDQLAVVGGMGAEELNRLPAQTVPVIMQIEKAVTAKAMLAVNNHNKGVLTEDGRRRRATAAISASELVKQSVSATIAQFQVENPPELKKFTTEFEQLSEPGETPREGKPLAEGIEVSQGARPQGRRQQRARA